MPVSNPSLMDFSPYPPKDYNEGFPSEVSSFQHIQFRGTASNTRKTTCANWVNHYFFTFCSLGRTTPPHAVYFWNVEFQQHVQINSDLALL